MKDMELLGLKKPQKSGRDSKDKTKMSAKCWFMEADAVPRVRGRDSAGPRKGNPPRR